jgi:hypothetical protein
LPPVSQLALLPDRNPGSSKRCRALLNFEASSPHRHGDTLSCLLQSHPPTTSVVVDRGRGWTTSPGPPPPATLAKSKLLLFFFTACHSSGEDNHHKKALESVTSSRDREHAGQCRGEKCTLIPPTRFRLLIPSSQMGRFLVVSGNRPIALFPCSEFPSFLFFSTRKGDQGPFQVVLSWGFCLAHRGAAMVTVEEMHGSPCITKLLSNAPDATPTSARRRRRLPAWHLHA